MPAVPWFAFACLLAAYHARVTSLRSLVFSFFSTIPEREQTGHFFSARSSVLITILSKPGSLGKSQSVTTLFNFPASCACWAVRYSYTHTKHFQRPHPMHFCVAAHATSADWCESCSGYKGTTVPLRNLVDRQVNPIFFCQLWNFFMYG